jgi:CheY-like chemotaxis protein
VSYTTFRDISEIETLQRQVSYDLVFVDFDYVSEESLVAYGALPQELILLTKSYFMKKIESLHANIFKTLYEPLNSTKVKLVLENYSKGNFNEKRVNKPSKKTFDALTSKFDANVLVAEDNIINQKLIQRTLEDLGLTVSIASNGLEAFQKRKDGNFDMIFMDIQMPFLDGVEATKEILEYEAEYNQPHVPIVALTANALKGDRERFLEAGLDEYTTKPLVRAEIVTLLNHFLFDYIIQEKKIPKSAQEAIETARVEEQMKQEEVSSTEPETIVEEVSMEDTFTDESIELAEEKPTELASYKADILLAKKTPFESKLYTKVLLSLGYTFEIANSVDEMQKMIEDGSYKLILFDKECDGLDLEAFSYRVKEANKSRNLDSYLVLINDSSSIENSDDALYVHESIKNIVNKDLLRLVFEKFI